MGKCTNCGKEHTAISKFLGLYISYVSRRAKKKKIFIKLSTREIESLRIIHKVMDKQVTQRNASEILSITDRQDIKIFSFFLYLQKRYRLGKVTPSFFSSYFLIFMRHIVSLLILVSLLLFLKLQFSIQDRLQTISSPNRYTEGNQLYQILFLLSS